MLNRLYNLIKHVTEKLYCLLLRRLTGDTDFCFKQKRQAMKKLNYMFVDRPECYRNGETCFRKGKQIFETTPKYKQK